MRAEARSFGGLVLARLGRVETAAGRARCAAAVGQITEAMARARATTTTVASWGSLAAHHKSQHISHFSPRVAGSSRSLVQAKMPESAQADEAAASSSLLTARITLSHETPAPPAEARQMETKTLGAEAVLQQLMDDVVDSCAERAELFHGRDPRVDLLAEIEAIERDTDTELRQICAHNSTEKERIRKIMDAVKEQNTKLRSLITDVEADYADAFDEVMQHLHTFGSEHLARAWAEAEATRATRAAQVAREQEQKVAAIRAREIQANKGNFDARLSAQAAEEREKHSVETLQQQVRQLTAQLHAETERADAEKTRADVAEKQLVKKFKEMEALTQHSQETSRSLLAKVDWLIGCWKREQKVANSLRIELRKANLKPVSTETETDPESFSKLMNEMYARVNEAKSSMETMQDHHHSLREALQQIAREETVAHAFQEAGRHQNDDSRQKKQKRHARRAARQHRKGVGTKAR